MQKNSLVFLLSISLLFSIMVLETGCSQTTQKTETHTVTEEPIDEHTTKIESTTNTSTETTTEECGGVLSCTVDAIGTVIALPFRAVGALIGAIF